MSETKGTPVYRYQMADYLNTAASGAAAADYHLMNVMETMDESPNAQTQEKAYTGDKGSTTLTTGYKPQYALTGDLYKDNAVMKYLRDIGEERQVGVETDLVRVRLYEPIASKADTYYARKERVSVEISSIAGKGGEIVSIEGNLNAIGDCVVGEFNTATATFKSAAEVAAGTVSGG